MGQVKKLDCDAMCGTYPVPLSCVATHITGKTMKLCFSSESFNHTHSHQHHHPNI